MKTLFIKLGGIGDVVQAAVAMHELRRSDPRHQIDWVAGSQTGDLVEASGVADHVTVIDDPDLFSPSLSARLGALFRGIRAIATHTPYDRLIVAYSDRRYQYLGLGVRAKRRLSFRDTARVSPIQHRSRIHEYWRLLSGGDAEPIDIIAATRSLGSVLALESATRHRLSPGSVVLAPGGARNLARDDRLRRRRRRLLWASPREGRIQRSCLRSQ